MPQITLEVPDDTFHKAQDIAKFTGKPVEDILLDWVNRLADNAPIELLSDDDVLAIADAKMPQPQQDEMNNLLALNRESNISNGQQSRLDELMAIYRQGLVGKAQAMKAVVERGLHPQNIDEG